tara:strand:- start:320 stop:1258 length:939 start_codon:yes stop_codon:yes gene_type:complete
MAGILNTKQRILDALITVDGRRQMANRTIDISFATFSDEGIFYDSEDGVSARDISDLAILEVASLPRDTVIPEVDDDGAFSLSLADGNKVVNGRKVVSGSLPRISVDENGVRTVIEEETVLTGTINAYSSSLDVMRTAMKHFEQLNVIRTDDGILESDFRTDTNSVNLTSTPIPAALAGIRPMIFDDNLNHLLNMKFLPPEVEDNNNMVPLADYPKFNKEPYNNFSSFMEDNLIPALSRAEVIFTARSKSNNLLGQFFEINKNGVNKLLAIDYGEFVNENEERHRVFILGKTIRDANGTAKFCKLFTLVFER